MISYIKGKILNKTQSYLILENLGIGYKVFTTPELLENHVGQELEMYTYLKVADDGQTLFGLKDMKTLTLFELLITVTGVGPKMALTILSAVKPEMLENAIANEDVDIFTRLSGVGKKTAQRIILELKTKVGVLSNNQNSNSSDIYDALVALGYSNNEVRSVINKLEQNLSKEEQIKQALKYLSKN